MCSLREGGGEEAVEVEPKILFEDSFLLVVDKPSGIVVNRAESVKGKTVQEWAEEKLKIKPFGFVQGESEKLKVGEQNDFVCRAGIVHRLDKETSGVLVIAKDPETFVALQKQFKDRTVSKVYRALVHGKVTPEEGVINATLGRLPWNRRRFGVLAGGRVAQTAYRLLLIAYRVVGGNNEYFSLLELYPKTGRTHQIRVHLKSIGHPVVSDPLYAGRKTNRRDRAWCPRLFLHAAKISFRHPVTDKEVSFDSQLPSGLTSCLTTLRTE